MPVLFFNHKVRGLIPSSHILSKKKKKTKKFKRFCIRPLPVILEHEILCSNFCNFISSFPFNINTYWVLFTFSNSQLRKMFNFLVCL